MQKLIALFLFCTFPGYSALPFYSVVFETRTTGADTNGAGFVTGSAGTDMSQFDNKNASGCTACQSATANLSVTDLVSVGTATVTSVTANFTAAIVGNIVYITGTGLTTGWYEAVTFTNSTTIVLDSSPGTGIGGTINVGGALLTLARAALNMALASGTGVWVKGGTYNISATVALDNPSNVGYSWFLGYGTTRGDNGQPTISAQTAMQGADQYMVFNGGHYGITFGNFILEGNHLFFTRGLEFGSFDVARNVRVQNLGDAGFVVFGASRCYECSTFNIPDAATNPNHDLPYAFTDPGNVNFYCYNCRAESSLVNGAIAFQNMIGVLVNPVAANFTGTTTKAFTCCGPQEGDGLTILNASVYGFTGDAFVYGENSGIDTRPFLLRNAVIDNVGGFCINDTGSLPLFAAMGLSDHVFCNPTGAGFYGGGWPPQPTDVTLTATPFTSGGTNDVTLNNTSGGGAAVRGAGNPSYLDGGALQHQDSGGGATATGRPIL